MPVYLQSLPTFTAGAEQSKNVVLYYIKRPELCEVLATFWGVVENQKGNHSRVSKEGVMVG